MERPLDILLIEDDGDDVELLQEAFENYGVTCRMHVINDGSKVSAYLSANNELPDVIVMDLNLPKVHGKDILKEIKASAVYCHLPIVILTTSSSADDRKITLDIGANEYLIKPITSAGLTHVVSAIIKLATESKM